MGFEDAPKGPPQDSDSSDEDLLTPEHKEAIRKRVEELRREKEKQAKGAGEETSSDDADNAEAKPEAAKEEMPSQEEIINRLEEAEQLSDITDFLEEIDGLQGSGGFYSSAELIDTIITASKDMDVLHYTAWVERKKKEEGDEKAGFSEEVYNRVRNTIINNITRAGDINLRAHVLRVIERELDQLVLTGGYERRWKSENESGNVET